MFFVIINAISYSHGTRICLIIAYSTCKDDLKSRTLFSDDYENMSIQYTAIFHGSKNEKIKIFFSIIFLFLLKT